jgi:hydrogenase-4 component E
MDGVLSMAHAGSIIDAAALGLIALALLSAIVPRFDVVIALLAAQGVLLATVSGAAALAEQTWRPWAALALALVVKVVGIPLILTHVLRRLSLRREMETVVPLKLALPIAAGLVLLAYDVTDPIGAAAHGAFDAPNALPAALALLLLGLFTMVTRKKALIQVAGLVTMENGLYLAAVAATHGLPIVVELGIAMDVLTGIALMGLVIHEINRIFGGTNTDTLRSLTG